MTEKIYSTAEAAEYLGLSVHTLKHHIHRVKDLVPDVRLGRTLGFYRDTLDHFMTIRRPGGRPPSSK